VTVSGSFIQAWPEIVATIDQMQAAGASVLSPRRSSPRATIDGFVYLEGETGPPKDLESGHLDAIKRSDLLYVVNPEGYTGRSVSLEIGFAIASGVPVYCSQQMVDPVQAAYCVTSTPNESLRSLASSEDDLRISDVESLVEAQRYVSAMARVRGFDLESESETLILLMEEVGELARATRTRMNLSISESTSHATKSVRLELADCLIYLLHYANQAGIDMLTAFREKERENREKVWRGGQTSGGTDMSAALPE
jgi:NTP pyrophosphatase (non-canonical NTP hydrolase)